MCVFDETGHHFYAKENYLGGKVLWLEKKASVVPISLQSCRDAW